MCDITKFLEDLKSPEWQKRQHSLEQLENLRACKSLGFIVKALKDPEAGVRWRAARALGKIGNKLAVPYLVEALKDSNGEVRLHAVMALGDLRDIRSVFPLIDMFDDDYRIFQDITMFQGDYRESSVRGAAIYSLQKIGDEGALPALKKALKGETNNSIRILLDEAIESLTMIVEDEFDTHVMSENTFIEEEIIKTALPEKEIIQKIESAEIKKEEMTTYPPEKDVSPEGPIPPRIELPRKKPGHREERVRISLKSKSNGFKVLKEEAPEPGEKDSKQESIPDIVKEEALEIQLKEDILPPEEIDISDKGISVKEADLSPANLPEEPFEKNILRNKISAYETGKLSPAILEDILLSEKEVTEDSSVGKFLIAIKKVKEESPEDTEKKEEKMISPLPLEEIEEEKYKGEEKDSEEIKQAEAPEKKNEEETDIKPEMESSLKRTKTKGKEGLYDEILDMPVEQAMEDHIKEQIKKFEDTSMFTRMDAVQTLENIGEASLKYLLNALEDQDWRIREGAAEALMAIGDIRTIPAIKRALPIEPEKNIRDTMEKAIEKLEMEIDVNRFIKNLNDSNVFIQMESMKALEDIGKPAINHLLKALDSEDWKIREGSVEVLSRIGDYKTLEKLKKMLKTEKDKYVRKILKKAVENLEEEV